MKWTVSNVYIQTETGKLSTNVWCKTRKDRSFNKKRLGKTKSKIPWSSCNLNAIKVLKIVSYDTLDKTGQ